MAGEWAVRRATLDDLPAILAFGASHIPPHYTPLIGPEAARAQVEQWSTAERMGRAIDHGQVVVAVADADVLGVGERGEWCGDRGRTTSSERPGRGGTLGHRHPMPMREAPP